MNSALYTRSVMNPEIEREAPGIALVAHDACKQAMLEWARFNRQTLSSYTLYTTGTTGAMLTRQLDLKVKRLLSGPYGGDARNYRLIDYRPDGSIALLRDSFSRSVEFKTVKEESPSRRRRKKRTSCVFRS